MTSNTHEALNSWPASLDRLIGTVRVNEPLSRHCTLRVGGPAAFWVEPHTREELQALVQWANMTETPITFAGLGSNTLFPDEGINGLVIRLKGALAKFHVLDETEQGARVYVGAGTINAHLVRGLLKQGYIGHEFLVLIPGTFGGSLVMNAGTKEHEVSSILESATLLVPTENGIEFQTWSAQQMAMAYRHTELPTGAIVVDGTILVTGGDVDSAREHVDFDKTRRNNTQPYKLASVGSTFANPPGDYAGRLIEACELKGTRIGGAQISPLHANFFINEDNATAHDFLSLMALARHKVRQNFGITLRPEVCFVGFDGWQALQQLEEKLQ